MPKAFNFSIFFSSPGLSALRSQQSSSLKPSDRWIGFTYLPSSEELSSLTFRREFSQNLPGSGSSGPEPSPAANRFATPARPASRQQTLKASRTGVRSTKRRRPVSELEAFNEVLEYGVLSVKRRTASRSPPSPDLFGRQANDSAESHINSPIHHAKRATSKSRPPAEPIPEEKELPAPASPLHSDAVSPPQRSHVQDASPTDATARAGRPSHAEQHCEPLPDIHVLRDRHTRLVGELDSIEQTYERFFRLALNTTAMKEP